MASQPVLIGALALVVVNLLSVALPLLVRGVIDDLQDGFTFSDVLRQAAVIIALATVMGGVRLWSRMLVFGVGRQVEAGLKQEIFDHMLRQEPGWVQTTGSGEVISRATSDVENVRRQCFGRFSRRVPMHNEVGWIEIDADGAGGQAGNQGRELRAAFGPSFGGKQRADQDHRHRQRHAPMRRRGVVAQLDRQRVGVRSGIEVALSL